MNPTTEKARFVLAAKQLTPALQHSNSARWQLVLDMQNQPQQVMAQLHYQINARYPAAGAAYWGIQCWRQISWQPVYLAIAGVYGAQLLPQLTAIKQRLNQSCIDHYDIAATSWFCSDERQLVRIAAKQLRALADNWLTTIRCFAKLPSKTAYCLLADALCHCLSFLSSQNRHSQWIIKQSHYWLEHMQLIGASGLALKQTEHSDPILTLTRKACCLHYRVDANRLCSNCPKNNKKRRSLSNTTAAAQLIIQSSRVNQ